MLVSASWIVGTTSTRTAWDIFIVSMNYVRNNKCGSCSQMCFVIVMISNVFCHCHDLKCVLSLLMLCSEMCFVMLSNVFCHCHALKCVLSCSEMCFDIVMSSEMCFDIVMLWSVFWHHHALKCLLTLSCSQPCIDPAGSNPAAQNTLSLS